MLPTENRTSDLELESIRYCLICPRPLRYIVFSTATRSSTVSGTKLELMTELLFGNALQARPIHEDTQPRVVIISCGALSDGKM